MAAIKQSVFAVAASLLAAGCGLVGLETQDDAPAAATATSAASASVTVQPTSTTFGLPQSVIDAARAMTTTEPPWTYPPPRSTTTTTTAKPRGEWQGCPAGEKSFYTTADGWICKPTPQRTAPKTTVKPRPPKPECPKGEFGVWQHSEWAWSECRRPSKPRCDDEYPDLLWVDGEWGCYESCGHGYVSAVREGRARCVWDEETCDEEYPELLQVDGEWGCYAGCDAGWTSIIVDGRPRCRKDCDEGTSETFNEDGERWCLYDCPGRYPGAEWEWVDGRAWCLRPIVCAEGLRVKIRISGQGGRKVCAPSEALTEPFWERAFDMAKVDAADRRGKWIGGLVRPYGLTGLALFDADYFDYYRNEVGKPSIMEELHGDHIADFMSQGAYRSWAMQAQAGFDDIHVCYGHDCFMEYNCPDGCGLVGSSNPAFSSCVVHVWDEPEGVFFVMSVDESVPVCLDAYRKVAAFTMNQASFGSDNCYAVVQEGWRQFEHEGVLRDFYTRELSDCVGEEITLGARGVVETTWVSAKDFG